MTASLAPRSQPVLEELVAEFGGRYTREELRAHLNDAALQLRGSLATQDCLPELAVRLVTVRLSEPPAG